MHLVDSAAAPPLDEENSATEHGRVSNDENLSNAQENLSLMDSDQNDLSVSRDGQVFMQNANLTASPQPISRRADSNDETGSSSTHPVNSNDSFSDRIKAHVQSLSAEQRLKDIVENSNLVEDICESLNFSLPLAQLLNALQWDQHLASG